MAYHAGGKSIVTVALAPVLVDQSAANTTSAAIDMQGYDRVRFIDQLGGMVNGAILSSWAIESNESNLGNASNVVSAENTSVQAALTNVPNTANNSVQVLDIYRPTKRYVGVVVDAVTANITLLGVLAERFRGSGVNPPTQPSGFQYTSFRAS
jgi:hypothetical protein